MKHKIDDYKISGVKYYLKNKENPKNEIKYRECG